MRDQFGMLIFSPCESRVSGLRCDRAIVVSVDTPLVDREQVLCGMRKVDNFVQRDGVGDSVIVYNRKEYCANTFGQHSSGDSLDTDV